ncbi:retrotransposon-related protein, partial [Tanacetum coccineum]
TEEEHLEHLRKVLEVMKEHSLFAKLSKCHFGVHKVEYLGHIITKEGVVTDPSKIQAMITKKNAFEWDDAAQMAFSELKQAMTQALVLALPNFQKTFVVEIDASSLEIGAVLQQEGHLITYLSKTLSPKHQSLSIYEKEFFVVLMALEKWRGNLLDRHFKIKIYYFSLKYLLDQRLTTPFQTKWLPKLLGYDYEISYKKGNENIVADALSRVEYSVELNSLALSTISSDLFQKIKDGYDQDNAIKEKILQLTNGTYKGDKYTWEAVVLRRKGKIVVGNNELLRTAIIRHFHAEVVRVIQELMSHAIRLGLCSIGKECIKWSKLPEKVWSEISMDFVVGLPKSQGKTVIFVVVDRLIVYGQTPPLHVPYVAGESAVELVDRTLKARETAIEMLKFHFKRAQDRMKMYANRKRSEREFTVGMWFDKFIYSETLKSSNYDSDAREARQNFKDYTQMEAQSFKDLIIQHAKSIEQCSVERTRHEQEIHNRLKRLNERKLRIQECMVQKVNASGASSREKDCSRIISDKGNDQGLENQINTSGDDRSRNECNDKSTYGDDTDIRPSYNIEPMVEVPYTAEYNVFAVDTQHSEQPECIINTCVVENVDSNVIPDSPDMCDNEIQTDQNAVECDEERVALANLIKNLKLDVAENKKIQKQLKKANISLAHELKECKSILAEISRTLRESNSIRDSCLIALQNNQTELETYKTLNDRTVDYVKLENKLNETLGLLAQKEIVIKEGLKLKACEISIVKEIHNELVKQSLITSHITKVLSKRKQRILFGANNLPPMLDKDLYDSWKSRMKLYMQNREHGRMILESIEHGPLIWPTIEENGVTRTKKYAELSTAEKIQVDCDMKATNIILQGLPTDIYSLVNHHRVAKDLGERV